MMAFISVVFPVAVIKYPGKSYVMEDESILVHGARFWSVLEELTAAGA